MTFIREHKHLWILCYFIPYLTWFSHLEKTVTTHFHVIHMRIDDYIPFCEYFIVPYLLWFVYVGIFLTYAALFSSKHDFYKMCAFLYTGMTVFLIISTVYPNGHFLRPYTFERQNIFTLLCARLYARDTATNLFPSIHVYNSLAVHSFVKNNCCLKKYKILRGLSFVLCVSIILATMFLKQHSAFDVLVALVLGFVMYQIVYVHNWENTFHNTTSKVSHQHRGAF